MKFSEEAKENALSEIKEKVEKEKSKRLNIISIGRLLTMNFPKNLWTVEKLIPTQGISIIASVPGSFKTWLILLMARCIASGEKFLGEFQCQQANVLIVDEENALSMLRNRSELLDLKEDLPIHISHQSGVLVSDDGCVDEIIKFCLENNIKVIFFDSLVRIHEAEENSASEISRVFRNIKKFCQKGMTVVLTHHERKEKGASARTRLRGSSDILAAVDCLIAISRKGEEKKLVVEQPKMRIDEELEKFEIEIIKNENGLEFKYLGAHTEQDNKKELAREIIISFLEFSESKISKKDILETVKKEEPIADKVIRDTLDDLIEKGVVGCEQGRGSTKLCFLVEETEGKIVPCPIK